MNSTPSNQVAQLEVLDEETLESIAGGDRWGGNSGGVQCVDKLNADGSFTEICSVT